MTFPIVFLRYFAQQNLEKSEFNHRYRKFSSQNCYL